MYISEGEQRLWNSALAANKVGDYRRAIALFNRITQHELAFMNIAILLCRIGHHRQALPCLTKVITLQPSMVIAYYQRGICYYDIEAYEEASQDFRQAHILMNGEAMIAFEMSGSEFVLRSTDILYNQDLALSRRGLEEDRPGGMSDRALASPSTSHDVYRLPSNFVFDPPEKEWDSASTLTANSTKPDMCETTIFGLSEKEWDSASTLTTATSTESYMRGTTIPLGRFNTGSSITLACESLDETSVFTFKYQADRPTRKQLNRAVGKDMVPQTTEISSLPCSGIRIPHGPLNGLMAYRLVVEPYPRAKFIHFRRSVVTNFIVDNEEGESIVPPETLTALGYPDSLTSGTAVTLLIQGVFAKCVVGYPGDAGRLGRDFLTSGGLTSYFDTRLVAPVLYVSGDATGPPKRESIFATFPRRLSFRLKLIVSRLSGGN